MNYIESIMKTNLNNINAGCYAEILGISGGEGLRDKVLSLGLLPGKTVQVISNRKQGPVIIKVNGTRLIVGRGMSEKIHVSLTLCDPGFKDSHNEA
ncbi:MAG TPA: FeoA family protein [Spirochaetota bacterium]|nr:FeoA family protein [Spirochaetota bacterium]